MPIDVLHSAVSVPNLRKLSECGDSMGMTVPFTAINPLNAELNPFCHLLAFLGAHHILHVSGIRVNVEGS